VATFNPSSLSSTWLKAVDPKLTRSIACGGGTFVVAALCDRVRQDGEDSEKKNLKDCFGDSFREEVEVGDMRGKAVLLEALTA